MPIHNSQLINISDDACTLLKPRCTQRIWPKSNTHRPDICRKTLPHFPKTTRETKISHNLSPTTKADTMSSPHSLFPTSTRITNIKLQLINMVGLQPKRPAKHA
ncbi:hypothetical protein [Rubritalea tangerina]|uniref:hypothetical protein n=1 Tax=Rubritalea tangerina TaxID=430798 RepID=UPI0036147955